MSSKIQNKLLQYEASPPLGMWDKIAVALYEGPHYNYPDKLYHFEEKPPAHIWDQIKGHLNKSKAIVVPIYKRYSQALKYIGAASVLIIIAVSVAIFLGKRTGSEETVITPSNKVQPELNNITTQQNNSTVDIQPDKQIAFVRSHTQKNSTPPKRSIFSIGPRLLFNSGILMNDFFSEMVAQKQNDIDYNSYPDKFIVYSDGDGNVTRLPKKVFDLFACPPGDVNCRERIKGLQQKIANSSFTSDFSGILDMLHNLQDNQ